MATNPLQTPAIDMHPIASTNISRAGYDKPSRTLAVEFTNGAIYHHHEVPEQLWVGLRSAHSPGRYYNMNLKGLYDYERVN